MERTDKEGLCSNEVEHQSVALIPDPPTDNDTSEDSGAASPVHGELGMEAGDQYNQLAVRKDANQGSRSSSVFSDDDASTACLSITALSNTSLSTHARSTTSLNTQISYVTVGQYEPISPCSTPTTPTAPVPVAPLILPAGATAAENPAFEQDLGTDPDCVCGAQEASVIQSGQIKGHRRHDSGSSTSGTSVSHSPRFPCLHHNRVAPGGVGCLPTGKDGPLGQFPGSGGAGDSVSMSQPPDVQEVKMPPAGYPEVSLEDTLPHKLKLVKTNSVGTDISTGSKASAVSRATSWDERTCRICWLSEETEPVIQPCYCSGSSAWVHASCLQKWLQLSNAKSCEICMFQFQAKKRMKPISQWQWRPGKTRQLAQLEATIILLGVVTPPLLCGIILCSQKIRDYMHTPENAWKTAGLMTLVLVSVATYLGAVIYFLRKVKAVCRSWVATNRQTVVTLVSANGRRDEQVWSIT